MPGPVDWTGLFMIWYKCDVGYTNIRSPSNLSDFTWLDKDVPYTIFTVSEHPEASSTDKEPLSDIYNKFERNFGDNIYTWYQAPYMSMSLNSDLALTVKNFFPSMFIGYKNSWQYSSSEKEYMPYFAVYIRALKILFLVDDDYNRNYRYLVVPESGNLYSSEQVIFPFGFTFTGGGVGAYHAYAFVCVDYNKPSDLKDPSKTYLVSFTIYSRDLTTGYYQVSKANEEYLNHIFGAVSDIPEPDGTFFNPDDPYEPGGDSGPSDLPPGTFDDSSDPIPLSPLPTLSSANTGFTRIYNPTLSQVQDLARYLWTDESIIQTMWNHIKQYFEDPMQAIIGFNLVPVKVPDGGTQNFSLMYIDTGVSMNVAANQFVDVDCGTLKIERYYGSALDQSPYTKVSAFLPYIGTVQLDTDEVMGSTLQVIYRVDICSGSCVANVLVDGSVIYQYSGHCAINIPISSSDFSSYVTAAISVAKLAIGAAVGGTMGALAGSVENPSQQTNQVVTTTRTTTKTARNPATGRQITTGTKTVSETRESQKDVSSTQASFDYLSPYNITNTVGQIMASKPNVEHSGSFSGNTGYLGVRRPFVIIQRPNMCKPAQYEHFNGFPAMITMLLSECQGFTRVQQVQLTGMTATNPEQAEILGLLKSGVIF